MSLVPLAEWIEKTWICGLTLNPTAHTPTCLVRE